MAPGRWEESGQMHLATREEESRKVWICVQISPDREAWPGIQGEKHLQVRDAQALSTPLQNPNMEQTTGRKRCGNISK